MAICGSVTIRQENPTGQRPGANSPSPGERTLAANEADERRVDKGHFRDRRDSG